MSRIKTKETANAGTKSISSNFDFSPKDLPNKIEYRTQEEKIIAATDTKK